MARAKQSVLTVLNVYRVPCIKHMLMIMTTWARFAVSVPFALDNPRRPLDVCVYVVAAYWLSALLHDCTQSHAGRVSICARCLSAPAGFSRQILPLTGRALPLTGAGELHAAAGGADLRQRQGAQPGGDARACARRPARSRRVRSPLGRC